MRKYLIKYKNQIGDLQTNEDLKVYKDQLYIVKDNKLYFRRIIKSTWPVNVFLGMILAMLFAGAVSDYTDKAWMQACAGVVFSALLVFIVDAGVLSEEYKALRDAKRKEKFLSKAIREYEASKAQQSNAINNVAINTK